MKTVLRASLLALTARWWPDVMARLHVPCGCRDRARRRVVESQMQEVPVNLRSTGTVHARETAVLSAQVMAASSKCWCTRETA